MTKPTTAGDTQALSILLVTQDQFPPFRPAAKLIFADELSRRGHRIDWLLQASSPAVPSGAQRFAGGIAYVAPTDGGRSRWRRLRKNWLDVKNDLRIFGLLKRKRYSAIQVKDEYLAAIIALVAAKLFRVPFLYWLAYPHGDALMYVARRNIARYRLLYLVRGWLQRWLLYRVIMPSSLHVFVQSDRMRDDAVARGIPREKMTPVPSTVNLTEIRHAESLPPIRKPAGERWIVYLGTLTRERSLDVLVEAMATVLKRAPDARLILVGSGQNPADEQWLRSEAERLGVAHAITITGWLPMYDAWAHVRAADVCVSPIPPVPIYECGSPTKLVEYMAFGKPVVANEQTEQTAVMRESGGGLLCPWSSAGFADAILELLENPDKAAQLGIAGRRYVEAFRAHSKMADVVESVYWSVLTGGQPGRAERAEVLP